MKVRLVLHVVPSFFTLENGSVEKLSLKFVESSHCRYFFLVIKSELHLEISRVELCDFPNEFLRPSITRLKFDTVKFLI